MNILLITTHRICNSLVGSQFDHTLIIISTTEYSEFTTQYPLKKKKTPRLYSFELVTLIIIRVITSSLSILYTYSVMYYLYYRRYY